MMDDKQIGTGIVASIITGTIATILGGIVLSSVQSPARLEIEMKPPSSVPNPIPPAPPPKNSPVPPPLPAAPPPLLDQVDAQKKEIDTLKQALAKLSRDAASRNDFGTKPRSDGRPPPAKQQTRRIESPGSDVSPAEPSREQKTPSRLHATPPPRPTRAVVFFRVARQRTKQVEYDNIDEVMNFLRLLNLHCLRDPSYKDRPLGTRYIPIAVNKTASWRSYEAKNEAHRERIMNKMLALGIEATAEKPEEMDD